MKIMTLALIALGLAAPVAAQEATMRVNTASSAYETKITDSSVGPIYRGKLGFVDPARNPWRTVSAGKWTREIDPALRKDAWRLSASADYDGDGKVDTAKIYTNGQQTAVIVTPGAGGQPMVIYKEDGVTAGLEITGSGKRFMVIIPEVGYNILAMHKGKPVTVAVGD